jgi:tetratricopeptide (TPR) repeat protein
VGSLIGISIVGLLVGSYLTIASNHASLPTAHVKTNVSLASARPDSTNYFAQVNKLLADADNSRHQGHNSKAIQLLKEADDICNEKFDKDEIHADVYFALGLAQQSDQPQDAIASFEKAADLFSERRNDLGFRNASVNAANNLKDQRMYTEANPLYERAIQNMEKTGEKIKDPMSYAVDVSALAKNEAHLGHQAQADKLYQSALGVSRQSNYDPLNRLRMLKDVSEFYVDRYDERAKQLLEEATTVKVTVDAHNRGDVESLREQLGKLRERLSIKNKGP